MFKPLKNKIKAEERKAERKTITQNTNTAVSRNEVHSIT